MKLPFAEVQQNQKISKLKGDLQKANSALSGKPKANEEKIEAIAKFKAKSELQQ